MASPYAQFLPKSKAAPKEDSPYGQFFKPAPAPAASESPYGELLAPKPVARTGQSVGGLMAEQRQKSEQTAAQREGLMGLVRYAAPLVNPMAASGTFLTSPAAQSAMNAGSQAMAPVARAAFGVENPEDLAQNLGPATRAGLQEQGRSATQHLESIRPTGTNDALDNPILKRGLLGLVPGLGNIAADVVDPQAIRNQLQAGVEYVNGAPLGDGTDNFGPLTQRGLDRRGQTMQQRQQAILQAEQAARAGGLEGAIARGVQGSDVAPETTFEVGQRAGMSPEIAMATEAVMDPQNIIEALPIARVAGVAGDLRHGLSFGDQLGEAFARGVDDTGAELAQTADITNAAAKRLRTSQEVAAERSPYSQMLEPQAAPVVEAPGLKTAQEAAQARLAEREAQDAIAQAEAARKAAQEAEFAAQERLARLQGPAPEVILPEKPTPQPLEVVTQERGNIRETISPERQAEVDARIAEGQALEAEMMARRQAELQSQLQSSTLEIPGQTPTAPGRLILPGESEAGQAGKLIVPESAANPPSPYSHLLGDEVAPAQPGRRVQMDTPEAPPTPPPQRALTVDDYINRRAFGEVPESPVYQDLQRVQREMADLERERAAVQRRGAGSLSREERTANLKQADQLRRDAERLQARHDQLRQVAAQDAAQFRQAYRQGEAEIPGPTSLEQGYAPQSLEMGTPQPRPAQGGPAGTPPNQTATVGMPAPSAPAPSRRQSLGEMLKTMFTGRRPGAVKSKPELIRGMAATLDKMDGVKAVYGMGRSANKKTPGRFLSRLKLIEIKRGNLTGFLHELGHSFDERQAAHFSRRAELQGELDVLGSQGHSSWRPELGDLRRRQEGVAEFIRLKFEDPEGAARAYPKMNEAFEKHLDEMGDLGAEWRAHQRDLQLHLKSPGAARASSHIASRPDQKWKQGTIDNTVAGNVDRYDPLRAVDNAVAATQGTVAAKMAPTHRLYTQARLLKNLSKLKVKEFQTALKEVLKPVNDLGAEASRNFVDFITARHALEMEEAGLSTGVSKQDWQDLIDATRSDLFEEVADKLYAWQRSINDYAIAEGNLDPLRAEEWYSRWKYYVPTNREMENVIGQVDPKGFSGGGGRGLKAGQGPTSWTNRKKGGMQRIYDPLETMLENMVKTVDSTERNRLGKMLAQAWDDQAEGLGAYVRELKPSDAAGRQTIKVRDGRPDAGTFRERHFEFTDPDLYQAFTAMDEKQVGWFVRLLSRPANLLRWGATKVSLPFVINNLQRDTVGSALNSRVGSLGDIRSWPIVQSLDGLANVIAAHLGDARARELVQAFANSGGKQGLEEMYSSGATNANKIYRDIFSSMSRTEQLLTVLPRELRGITRLAIKTPGALLNGKIPERILGRSTGVLGNVPVAPFSVLEALSELSEQATRLGEFKTARRILGEQNPTWTPKQVDQQAGFEAMDLLDFDLRGNSELIRAVRQIVPFSGSSVTGLYRNYQAVKEHPAKFAAKAFGFLLAPTMTLYAMNRNNPHYWQLTQQDRDANWHIPIPEPIAKMLGIDNPAERFWRFKKPFLMGTVGAAAPERFMQWMFEKDPHAADSLLTTILSQSTPAGVDDLGGPTNKLIWEIGSNWDSFRGKDIEPDWLRKGPGEVPPYMRSDEYSSITARLLSQGIQKLPIPQVNKLSPLQLDHILRGMTGGGGDAIVKGRLFGNTPGLNRLGIDPLLSAATGMEEAKASRQQFLGQVPTEGRHESENRFFARLSELRQTVNDPKNPDSKKMGKMLDRYESVEKDLKDLYGKRSLAKDEAQRMQINRKIVQITEQLEPPTGRQKELRRQ